MKLATGLISLSAAAALFTGCGDTGDKYTEATSQSVTGNVIGCLTDNDAVDPDPVVGATITIGSSTGTSGADGCFSVSTSVVSADELNTATGGYTITHDMYNTNTNTFTHNSEVVGGVLANIGTIALTPDTTSPRLTGINNVMYAGSMLKEGIDGKTQPIQLALDEKVVLADDIDSQIMIKVYDPETAAFVTPTTAITATATLDSTGKILSIKTSEAITAGNYVGIMIPTVAVMDSASNELRQETNAEHAGVNPVGTNYVDTLEVWVRVFKEEDMSATAITTVSQAAEDTSADMILDDGEYDEVMTALETANAAFKNIAKNDTSFWNAKAIVNFNNDPYNKLQALGKIIANDAAITVANNVAKVKFTPTNASYYVVKAYDESNSSITLSNPFISTDDYSANIDSITYGSGRATIIPGNMVDDIEFGLGGLSTMASNTVVITPYSASGNAGTAVVLTVKDNVPPTAALQYSYDVTQDGSTFDSTTTGGVTSSVYGGSGELANGTDTDTSATTYSIGTPYLEMTTALFVDHNATTANTGTNALPATYMAADYTTWTADANSSRTFGVAFTEPITVSGTTATLTTAGGTAASSLITATSSTDENVTSTTTGITEHLALVTVSNIHTLVNDHNGSVLDLTSVTTDKAGNSAVNGKVVLLDKIEPFIISASGVDFNQTSTTVDGTFTFNEALASDVNATGTAGGIIINGNPAISIGNACISMATNFKSLTMADCNSGATAADGNTTVQFGTWNTTTSDANGNAATGSYTFKTSSSTLSN